MEKNETEVEHDGEEFENEDDHDDCEFCEYNDWIVSYECHCTVDSLKLDVICSAEALIELMKLSTAEIEDNEGEVIDVSGRLTAAMSELQKRMST